MELIVVEKKSRKRFKCEHGRERNKCKECGGASICEHDRQRSQCKDCGGACICEHDRYRSQCKECGGASICEHDRRRNSCKECGGASFCEHDRRRVTCKECGGASICEHDRKRSQCKECDGRDICEHDRRKSRCKECGGSELCKTPLCETTAHKKYDGICCINLRPDIEVSRNYKTKEKNVVDHIKETFPNFTWYFDKKVLDGCSNRRPDLLLDMGSHIIIVEVDENKHSGYECICENKRLMLISQDLNHRPIVFIRFNPDGYVLPDGRKVSSCWRHNKQGVLLIAKKKEAEWQQRIASLKAQIQYWINNITEKTVEIIELFY